MKSKRLHGPHDNQDHRHHHHGVDPRVVTTERGKWAVKWSFIALMITALLQVLIVSLSSSVALLADTIHNFGDAFTALPLWIAFNLARRKPTRRFTYGLGRVEDLAGVFIVLVILASAVSAGYESVDRFIHPRPVQLLWAVAVAALIGFAGNELVARFRIKVGKEINSAALRADGHHARVDGLTSLSVLFSVLGIWLGYPLVDPIIGLLITIAILRIVWETGKSVLVRLVDGVDPEIVDEIKDTALHTDGVREITEVRARWSGHQLHAEINLAVSSELSVGDAHDISQKARHKILHRLPFLSNAVIHIDPSNFSGEASHRIEEHQHGSEHPHGHP
jgi:cation diffusion facilitator family transporter